MAGAVILAIESSQRHGEVAIRDVAGAVHVEPIAHGRRHEDDLMPAIDRLMRRTGHRPSDLGAVGVSIGPGGFTGLRIGITTAKMLGETRRAPIAAVPTALAAAEAISGDGPIVVVLAAKKEAAWCTRLNRDIAGNWRIDGSPGPATAADLDVRGVVRVVGDEFMPGAMRDACREAGIPIDELDLSAAGCLAVAARMLERGESTLPMDLSPLYSRQPEAVSLWATRRR